MLNHLKEILDELVLTQVFGEFQLSHALDIRLNNLGKCSLDLVIQLF